MLIPLPVLASRTNHVSRKTKLGVCVCVWGWRATEGTLGNVPLVSPPPFSPHKRSGVTTLSADVCVCVFHVVREYRIFFDFTQYFFTLMAWSGKGNHRRWVPSFSLWSTAAPHNHPLFQRQKRTKSKTMITFPT